MKADVIVVGAGAAGLMAAGKAAEAGARTVLLEKNAKAGRKIAITGKGRCNVTNDCDRKTFLENVVSNSRFLYSSLMELDPQGMMALLETYGVPLKTERGQRVFPVSDRSFDIIDGLLRFVKKQGVQIVYNAAVQEIHPDKNGLFEVKTNEETWTAPAVIVATGGKSYPQTGSDGKGHEILDRLGLDVTDCRPGLIPFTIGESWCRDLMGLSLKNVRVKVTEPAAVPLRSDESKTDPVKRSGKKNKPLFDELGEMLFTHFGVSGPLILSASSVVQADSRKKNTECAGRGLQLHIDLKPGMDEAELDKRLLKDFDVYRAKEFRNALDDLLPRKLIPVVVRLSGIDPCKKTGDLSREERKDLGVLLKDLTLTITGTRPLEEAIITMGGVSVKEMDPSTMMVRMIPGLFVCGELLDLDAMTGGFNLQIAFSTGALAGRSAAAMAAAV